MSGTIHDSRSDKVRTLVNSSWLDGCECILVIKCLEGRETGSDADLNSIAIHRKRSLNYRIESVPPRVFGGCFILLVIAHTKLF